MAVYENAEQLRAALLTKLKQSGLDAGDAKLLKFEIHKTAKPELPLQLAGFKIPYFDFAGKPLNFYRFRYFPGQQNQNGFSKLVADQFKELRYAQPANSGNHLYLPPTVNWMAVAKDVSTSLIITEGELKAACLVKGGLPAIGLGGVWNFKTKTLPILDEFKNFVLEARTVYIVFDSDASTNPNVVAAMNRLAQELCALGAMPYICTLPSIGSSKTGADDYIVEYGYGKFASEILRGTSVLWRQAEELFKLNEEVVYVEDPGLVLRLDTGQRISPRSFVDHAYATRRIFIETIVGKSTKTIERSAPAEWLKWPQRSRVKRVTYRPGEERVLSTSGELNTWPGWACVPKRGSVGPWLEFLQILFGVDLATLRWFQQWLAYPLQFPGSKLYSAVLLWSVQQGTGKSTVGYTMERIYGKNFAEINNSTLHSGYTDWAVDRQFVMGDEVLSRDGKRDAADRFKSMITQRQLRVNIKYIPAYTVPDCINYLFTSNHPDAFFLEDADRRFMVHEIKGDPKPSTWFSDYYLDWLDNKGGKEALFYYLLNLDLTGFHPEDRAPMTSSKQEMVLSNKGDLAQWCDQLVHNPDYALKFGDTVVQRKIFTSSELLRIFDPAGEHKFIGPAQMGKELSRAQVARVWGGSPVRTETSGVQRLWIVRDVEQLIAMNPKKVIKMFDDERRLGGDKKADKVRGRRKY